VQLVQRCSLRRCGSLLWEGPRRYPSRRYGPRRDQGLRLRQRRMCQCGPRLVLRWWRQIVGLDDFEYMSMYAHNHAVKTFHGSQVNRQDRPCD